MRNDIIFILVILQAIHMVITSFGLESVQQNLKKVRVPQAYTAIAEYDNKTCYLYDVKNKPFKEVCVYGPERRTD